ncbi:MAG: hypothetical protein ACOC56_00590 [Atribacterota bacterium]
MDSKDCFVTPDINSIIGVVDTYLRWRQKNSPPRGYEIYHPSAFGGCLRQMQYYRYVERGLIKVEEQDFPSKILRLFDKGHNMHERWTRYMEDIGVLRGYWKCKDPTCLSVYGEDDELGCFKPEKCKSCGGKTFYYNEVSVVRKDLNFYGHADMILDFSNFDSSRFNGVDMAFNEDFLPKNPIVVDMKTANDYRFKRVLQKGPSLKYRVQLVIYANILPVEYGVLIYENKNTSDTAYYKIDKCTDTIFNKIEEQAKSMNEMVDRKLLPPPRPINKDDYECSNCPFKNVCHNSKIWQDSDLDKKRKSFYGNLL